MDKPLREEIARENRAEVQRARTGMAGADWAVVLGAVVVIAAIFGFIYMSNGVVPANMNNNVEPAAGSTITPATDDAVVNRNDNAVAPSGTAPGMSNSPSNSSNTSMTPDETPSQAERPLP